MKRPKTRKCGRCKKRFKVYDWNDGEEYHINAVAPTMVFKSRGTCTLRTIHLCQECGKEFFEKYMEGDNGKM